MSKLEKDVFFASISASPLVPGAAPVMMIPASSAPISVSQPVSSAAVSTPGLPRPLFPAAAAQVCCNVPQPKLQGRS